MPIYEYTCQDCEAQFEKFVRSMTGRQDITCPHCGGSHTKKSWSVFGMGGSRSGLGGMTAPAIDSCGTGST